MTLCNDLEQFKQGLVLQASTINSIKAFATYIIINWTAYVVIAHNGEYMLFDVVLYRWLH